MIEAARVRLGERVELQLASIEDFQTTSRFDAITSMMVMHNLQNVHERQSVYMKLHDALEGGGIYASVDIFEGECERKQELLFRLWREFLLSGFSEDEVDNKWLALYLEKDRPICLSDQISMLHKAGFSCVDVVHKRLGLAVVLACRQAITPSQSAPNHPAC